MTINPTELAAALGLPRPTDEQADVIGAAPGPMLVVAGAGSGKTKTMAARVVWMVANSFVQPDQVLGLTFTRKAAQQLTERIRKRLADLARAGIMRDLDPSGQMRELLATTDPQISTYHAYAGRLIAEHGLLLRVEPTSSLLSETQLWQIAHRIVLEWDGYLDLNLQPPAVTQAVLELSGRMAEHMVTAQQLVETAETFERLLATLPPGKGGRKDPNQKMRDRVAAQSERVTLLPIVQRLHDELARRRALDFGAQMSLAARLVTEHPQVSAAESDQFRLVLLDEYQDTGHSQRIMLRSLFGQVKNPRFSITAVGDPMQSIYGWRGASASNLPRFTTDFRDPADGKAAYRSLSTSWRNPPDVLELANRAADPLRNIGVEVLPLRAKPDAEGGDISIALFDDVDAERDWIASEIAKRWYGDAKPTSAVLVRRNADAGPIAEKLRAEGIPVEIVGLGGLLHTPEVSDVVAILRVIANPASGAAAMRILTGARWRLGISDLRALSRRANEISIQPKRAKGDLASAQALAEALAAELPADTAEQAGLIEALADPGLAEQYSTAGFARISALGEELHRLRLRASAPLPDLVADIERMIAVNVDAHGSPNLDAFAEVVARFAVDSAATVDGFIAFLDAAIEIEDGLPPGEVEVATDRVQVLTVHAAKGLEWEIVAIAHVSSKQFPSENGMSTWVTNRAELPVNLRGDRRNPGDADGVPMIDLSNLGDRKEFETALDDNKQALVERRDDEERRLFYVALTRTERVLLVSGSYWSLGNSTPRGPSAFLAELKEFVEPVTWAKAPEPGASNPLDQRTHEVPWPQDPLGERRPDVQAGADAVLAYLASPDRAVDDDREGWHASVDAILAQREGVGARPLDLPPVLSTTQLVALGGNADEFLERLRRPLPSRPNPLARRGTAFHAWLERRFGATRLLDFDDLPGAADADESQDFAALQAAFLASEWANRQPLECEVPFETTVGGVVLRGRIDAVFTEPDGGYLVVDWKTGSVPPADKVAELAVQLGVYRLAWARLMAARTGESGETVIARIRAAFHYVRDNRTVEPVVPTQDQLTAIIETGRGASTRNEQPIWPRTRPAAIERCLRPRR